MTVNYYEAVCFKPKKAITFFGFGLYTHREGADCKFKVQWMIDDARSEAYEIECPNETADQEKKWYTFDIRSVGERPVKCPEGTKIHCKVAPLNDESRKCWYTYEDDYDDEHDGYEWRRIPEQDKDFEMEYSSEC